MSIEITTRFSLHNALELARVARQAYDDPPTIKCDDTDTQVLIQDRPEAMVIAFRGSSDLHDYLTDSRCKLTSFFSGQKVHEGFLRAIDSVIVEVAQRAAATVKPIFVTGHSLGGALAILCVEAIRARKVDVQGCYTFGQPRVGNKEFAINYDSKLVNPFSRFAENPNSGFLTLRDVTFRFVHERDIVPRVPFLFGLYRHCGQEIFLDGERMILNPELFTKIISDAKAGWKIYSTQNYLAAAELFTDHHINNYIAAIEAIVPAEAGVPNA